jgi:hypothetical protein
MEARRVMASTLFLLLHTGCAPGISSMREGPAESVRTKGGVDSATARIHLLVAEGRYAEAETLLAEAVDSGLLAMSAATQLQERLTQLKAQEAQAEGSSNKERTCRSQYPDHPMCQALPEEYSHHSVQQALNAMKSRLGEKSLGLHKPDRTRKGPCPEIGQHYNVRMEGQRTGSIVCCPCCVDTATGPIQWMKCRTVW